MTTSVLVAGATGDLGRRIVREFLHHDTRIRVLTRPGSGTPPANWNVELRREVAGHVDAAPLKAASVLNGALPTCWPQL